MLIELLLSAILIVLLLLLFCGIVLNFQLKQPKEAEMNSKCSNYAKGYIARATRDFILKNIDRIDTDKSKLTIGRKFDKIVIIFNKEKAGKKE